MMKVWTEVTFAGRVRGASAEADKVVLPKLGHHYRRYLSNNNSLCYSGFVWFSISMLDFIIKKFLKLCACVFVLIKMNCFKKKSSGSHTQRRFFGKMFSLCINIGYFWVVWFGMFSCFHLCSVLNHRCLKTGYCTKKSQLFLT